MAVIVAAALQYNTSSRARTTQHSMLTRATQFAGALSAFGKCSAAVAAAAAQRSD
jgi:hypothetical protein